MNIVIYFPAEICIEAAAFYLPVYIYKKKTHRASINHVTMLGKQTGAKLVYSNRL